MSNTFLKINAYVGGTTAIVNSWFLLPKKALEIAEPVNPDAGIINKISLVFTVVSLSTNYTYQYNKYIKLDKASTKWLIYGFITTHVIVFGLIFYLLIKQEGVKDKVSYGISKYILPIISSLISFYHVIAMIAGCDKVTAYRILNTINGFLSLADFGPIHESMKTQPEVYFPVHGVRALLKTAEGGTLLVEATKIK
ncbi:hypothetical protein [Aquimarina aquimarini]|uniref:hypothetical protein n=1 Tax=Aquimarina aquimarini TaxID=1191734 RepID=UPI000D55E678|nr:hypothetical protein [Aquimarina aquimarini]